MHKLLGIELHLLHLLSVAKRIIDLRSKNTAFLAFIFINVYEYYSNKAKASVMS